MRYLYMKQKVFSIGEKYHIYDEDQNVIYHVKGQFFSIRNKMEMYQGDKHLFHIERKLFRFLPEYTLFSPDGDILASIKKNFTLFGGKLTIHSVYGDMDVNGQILQRDFQLFKDGEEMMTIHKKWISWGDTYEITIKDNQKEAFYVALVILIDAIYHQSSQHSHSNH